MKDYLLRGIDKDGKFRFVVARTSELVEEARQRHQTSATASAALGRTLTAVALMAETSLKNKNDSLSLTISGNGPLGNIVTYASNKGEIKGFVGNPKADAPSKNNKLDVASIVGNKGTIKTIMDLGLKESYTGQAEIISGEIAEDIANYYLRSEQVNTAVALGVLVDKDLSIINAGGYLIQLLPDTSEEDINRLEKDILSADSFSKMLGEYDNIEDLMENILKSFDIEFLERKELAFNCDCSKDRAEEVLISLGKNELDSIIEEDGQAEIVCHYCNSVYDFNKNTLLELREKIE